jgi:amino acid adenylation domain-containing protein
MAQVRVAARPALLLQFVRGEVAVVLAADGNSIADEQDLFATGMDSLMSIELKRRLEAGIGRSLPSGMTFNHPTIAALAAFLESRLDSPSPGASPGVLSPADAGSEALPEHEADITIPDRNHPLSYSQKALWFLHQQDTQSTAYHVSLSVRVLSILDDAALQRALQVVIGRHGILRTTYALVGGAPWQQISQQQNPAFQMHRIGDVPDAELRKLLEADARRPFDLERGPIMRASLYTRGSKDHALLLSVHHIAIDGWSILMLIEELLALYGEMTGGPVATLTQPGLEYGDYARWQEDMLGGPEGDRLWSYWRQKLAARGARIELPIDHPRPAIRSFSGASVAFQPDVMTAQRVMNLARRERATPFVVLLAAFQVFLFKLTGAEDVIVGTSTFARSKPEFMQVAGNFVNSVPIRGRLASTMTFRDFVLQLGATVIEAIEAQEFPLPLMVQRLQPERNASGSPLFDTFFSLLRFQQFKAFALLYGSGSDDSLDIGALRLAPFPIDQGAGQFDLSLQMVEISGSLRGAFSYRTDLFEQSTIRRFTAEYLTLLDRLTSDPDMALGAVRNPVREAAVRDESVVTLLDLLGKRDIRLLLDGDRLRISTPRGALDGGLKTAITARRDDIIRYLKEPANPAEERGSAAIRRIPRDRGVPASSAQQRLWFLDRIDPGRPTYNIGGGLRLCGPLDIGLLQQAINTLTNRHEAFRTRIVEHNGHPLLEILETTLTPVNVVDLSDRPAETRDAEVRRLGEGLMKTHFDMAQGRLAAILIIRLAADDHAVVLAMHHVVSDGWSMSIASHEVCALYDALATGCAADLAPLTIDYADYAAWEAEQIGTGRFAEHLAYWKEQLKGAPAALELPTDRPRPAVASHRGGRLRRYFGTSLIASLEAYSREHSVTLFMTMLAAWQVLMYRYSGQDDIVIGTPVANRDTPALESVVGCLVNNVALRAHLDGNPHFAEFLSQVKQTVLGAFDHRALPFDKVVQGLNPERNVSHAPIFQVLFTLMSFPVRSLAPAGLSAEAVELDLGASRFDLAIEIALVTTGTRAGQFGVLYDFDSDLFDERTIARLHDHFVNLLAAVATSPSCGIQDLPLITPAEARQILEEWNATALAHDASCVHHLLEATARLTPDAIAVTAGDATLSYRALDQNANRFAHLLRRRGIGPKALVGVCLDRTIDIPIALAAVLKAGATYVPLDPTHPEERLHYILEDAEVACVVTVTSFLSIFDGTGTPILLLDEEYETLALQPDSTPDVSVHSDDLAYVIYTSGSTGRPKGVEVEHRNVVSFLRAMLREPGMTAGDTLLAVSTLSFDIAGLEIWLPLSVGGSVVIASRTDVLDGARLIDLIETHGITVLQATPASWRLLLEADWRGKHDLKALCGGETMPRDLAAGLLARTGELWNMYGPTETTIWSTVERIQDTAGPITIGHPIANTRVYVLDLSGQLAPVGVIGELCIGGEGVARGYRKRAELTSKKFVEITLPDGTAERVYRTADIARFRGDGRLELLGRRDHQVKVRGYRVELAEIEAVLATVAGVKTCVVVTRELAPGDERLIGYVTATDGSLFDAELARIVLRRKLPEYMIPQLFVVLAALPMTSNYKIDRKALPTPQTPELHSDDPDVALMTPPQRRVADRWRSVLRTERVRLHDNFFDLGGHSMLLVKLHAELKQEFGSDFPLVELFQQTTVAAQADRLSFMSHSNDALGRARARAERQLHG